MHALWNLIALYIGIKLLFLAVTVVFWVVAGIVLVVDKMRGRRRHEH